MSLTACGAANAGHISAEFVFTHKCATDSEQQIDLGSSWCNCLSRQRFFLPAEDFWYLGNGEVLGFCLPATGRDGPGQIPDLALSGEAFWCANRNHPLSGPVQKSTKQEERNSSELPSSSGRQTEICNFPVAVPKPPSQHKALRHSFLRRWMIHNRIWLVSQSLSSLQEPVCELNIIPTDLAARSRAQIRPNPTIFFKYIPTKRHVRSVRRAGKLTSLSAGIERNKGAHCEGIIYR